MTANLTKTPDKIYDSYTVSGWAGIKPNVEAGVTKCSYVNARAVYINKLRRLKIATQSLFEIDGHSQLVLMELLGILDDYAPLIGLCYTKEQLIEESKFDCVLFDPWFGFPMQGRPDLTFNMGSIAFHPFNFEQQNRPINEMVHNYDGVLTKGRGLSALPLEISSGAPVSHTSVEFTLATTCVWVSPEERLSLLNGYQEIIFKEILQIGEHTEPASNTEKKVTFDLNCKGPVAYMWLTVQAREDVENGNHTKVYSDTPITLSSCATITVWITSANSC